MNLTKYTFIILLLIYSLIMKDLSNMKLNNYSGPEFHMLLNDFFDTSPLGSKKSCIPFVCSRCLLGLCLNLST